MREIFRREIRREKVAQNGPLYTTNLLNYDLHPPANEFLDSPLSHCFHPHILVE